MRGASGGGGGAYLELMLACKALGGLEPPAFKKGACDYALFCSAPPRPSSPPLSTS